MEMPSGAIVGTLAIGAIVAAGFWYAGDSGVREWAPGVAAQREGSPGSFPSASGRHVDWSADGCRLLILSRNAADAKGRITLHDLAQPHVRTTLDVEGDIVGRAALAIDGHILAAT